MLSIISLMADNVDRLEKYVDSMNSIQKLEDTSFYPAEVYRKLGKGIRLLRNNGKAYPVQLKLLKLAHSF
ncbi:MAG: hypothetical protein VR72_06760 [Clostridiaceae bacterium BRH_c20a]|nr:MAG: hypothetical protein VR72_06760 [Clostridiaceae bacterium BRH_c20a]